MAETLLFTNIPIEELKTIICDSLKTELKHFSFSSITSESHEDLLTRKDTAAILKITLPTLLLYTKQGRIHAYRIGRRVLYRRFEINQALKTIVTSPL